MSTTTPAGEHFRKRSTIHAPASTLFAWHARPGAFERLTPPWAPVRVVARVPGTDGGSITGRARVTLDVPVVRIPFLGAVSTRWIVEHRDYLEGRQFRDVQIAGPRLDRLFAYRHTVTAADLERHESFAERGTLKVAITGATGLIGRALVPFLTTGGHEVTRLVRRRDALAPGDTYWNPERGEIDAAALDGVDAVINLAGETLSERWTPAHKRAIRDSRVKGTALLARTLAGLPNPPKVFISVSAVGYYGDGGDRILDESSPAGTDFLATVARDWEAAAEPAAQRGIRVVHPRMGVVLAAHGGILERLLPPFKLGMGGKLGSGAQWMSWIALDDLIGALHFLLFTPSLSGPVNVTSPNPVTNAGLAKTLGHVLGRPAIAAVPSLVLKLTFGEMADTMLLAGQRVLPRKLEAAGFEFRHPKLEEALRWELGKGA